MITELALTLGALGATMAVAVVMVLYIEKRLKAFAVHLEELYGQLEVLLWKLE